MQALKTFEQFILEKIETSDLKKVYLTVDPKSGQRWLTNKGFAGSKFFIQLNFENYKDIEINPEFPVLNYNLKVTQKLLDEGLIKSENIYNHPKYITQSGSKEEFHKILEGDDAVPATAYSKDDALKIGFPLIAKPKGGHSGIGIQIFQNKEEFEGADHSKLDLYSQYIDKKSEHRLFNFKGTPWFWMEREPMNDKAKTGKGKSDEQMDFRYLKRPIQNLPTKFKELAERLSAKFDLPYLCFDMMEDKDGKLYVIESNAQPGVPYDSTVEAYKMVFKDFYGRDMNPSSLKKMDEFAQFLNDRTLKLDPDRFEIKDK